MLRKKGKLKKENELNKQNDYVTLEQTEYAVFKMKKFKLVLMGFKFNANRIYKGQILIKCYPNPV